MEGPLQTVTFLFTDIQGSTRLWEQHPEAMRKAVARHDGLSEEIIVRHRGSLVRARCEGDSLFAVFESSPDAVACAAALQHAYHSEEWPAETPIVVRMAVHTGLAEHRQGDYYGSDVNRAARLRAIAHGGQSIVSGATRDLCQGKLPEDIELVELGLHHLKDLSRPEAVFQIAAEGLPRRFPPLNSLTVLPNNLPLQLTSFVGREKEMAEAQELLAKNRLVTLIGSGGVGKTRLALHTAAELLRSYPDGVWLVELAPVSEGAALPGTVAAAVGCKETPGIDPEDAPVEWLKRKTCLIVLDNCEHLLEPAARLAERLLQQASGVRILATSQAPLNIPGEVTYRVPSLGLPDGESTPADVAERSEAVRLFLDRARAAKPGVQLNNENTGAVVALCSTLDGIPFAIELAAARVRALPVEKIAERVGDRFQLLTGGSRTALPRHQTLKALIDWSYDLLEDEEKELLHRLSVFVGGWPLEAAEAVCSGEGIEDFEVLDLLTALVEKSLVSVDESGEARYRLLSTVRQYAGERLQECGGHAAITDRHADWYAQLAAECAPKLQGPEQQVHRIRLLREHENLRFALETYLSRGEPEPAQRFVDALFWFWEPLGLLSEGLEFSLRALDLVPKLRTKERASVLNGAGNFCNALGRYAEAQAYHEQALSMRKDMNDQRGMAASYNNLGMVAISTGGYESAGALFRRTLEISLAENMIGGIVASSVNLGRVYLAQGELMAAETSLGSAIDKAVELGALGAVALAEAELGECALRQRNLPRARECLHKALRSLNERASYHDIPQVLETLAAAESADGHHLRAARLWGAAEAFREKVGLMMKQTKRGLYAGCTESAKYQCDAEAFDLAWQEGRTLSLAEAVEEGLRLSHSIVAA